MKQYNLQMKKIIIFLISTLLFTGCLEEYDLELEKVPPRLVVDGLITNKKGPYYVRLTESYTGTYYDPDNRLIDKTTPVKGALIIITDNVNQIDTLTPVNVDINVDSYGEYSYDYNTFRGYYKVLRDNSYNIIDTVWLSDPAEFNYNKGFYKTQNIVGIPGRTYSLKIICQNKEYTASSYMPSVPDIDSLGIIKIITSEGKSDYYSPLLYFSEPQETKDYYLIQLADEVRARGSFGWNFYWPFSILSDEFLEPYVNGLKVSSGANLKDYEGLPFFSDGNIYVRLSSLTKEAFLYYQALIRQIDGDGGTFQPSPASPPTNISNGALGFFRASAVSEKSVIYDYRYNEGVTLELLTSEATEITAITAVSGGKFNVDSWDIASKGICWSTNPNPTIDDFFANYENGTRFSCKMTDLTPNTKYYVRAYIVDYLYHMVHYGTQVEFTTLAE